MSRPVARRKSEGKAPKSSAPKRLLLVEDCAPLACLRGIFLAQQGYRVVSIADSAKAVRLLRSQSFDLVITDSELPNGSGWEVAQAAKKREVPVILSSGRPVRLAQREMTERGIDYVARKPCTLGHLTSLVRLALAKDRSQHRDGPL